MGPGRWRFPLVAHLGIRSIEHPQFEHLAGSIDPVEQIAFVADLGFSAVSDNGLVSRSDAEQRRIGRALERYALGMGTFTFNGMDVTPFAWADPAAPVEQAMERCLRAADRVGASVIGVMVCDAGGPVDAQLTIVAANLRRATAVAERHDLVIGLEPVSVARIPSALVRTLETGAAIIREVDAASLRLVADTCHIALGGGDPSAELREYGELLCALQVADVPDRVEPGAGILDFGAIANAITASGWRGAVETECSASEPGPEGESAMLARLDACFG